MPKVYTEEKQAFESFLNSNNVSENFRQEIVDIQAQASKDFKTLGPFHKGLKNTGLVILSALSFITVIVSFIMMLFFPKDIIWLVILVTNLVILLPTMILPLINIFYYAKRYHERFKFHFLNALDSSFGETSAQELEKFLFVLNEKQNFDSSLYTSDDSWLNLFSQTSEEVETFNILLPGFAGSLNELKVAVEELSRSGD